MDITAIVVNYNTAELIASCLQSLFRQKNVTMEIIVVDNASQDNSLEILTAFESQIRLIRHPENSGFGRANNLAAQQAQGRYLFLLNPDAALQTPHDLSRLLAQMDAHARYGVMGTQVLKATGESKPAKQYPGEKHIKKKFDHLPGEIAWVIGASMLIRKAAYEAAVGFDPDYFLYGEETDLCLRLRRLGWEIAYAPEIVVHHVGGASEKMSTTRERWMKKQQGLQLFYKKHYTTEETKKLIQKQRSAARSRLLRLRCKQFFRVLKEEEKIQWDRYQAVLDTIFVA